MGKWKYINWLIVVTILLHMYYYFSSRYEANALLYVLATAGWFFLAVAGYYIYVYRMNRPDMGKKNTITQTPLPTPPVKARPKVSFKKKD